MELNEEDFSTVASIRVPLSVAKQVLSLDWGLPRKKQHSLSARYLAAIIDGVQLRGLKQHKDDPEKKAKLEQILRDLALSENNEHVLETMDVSDIESLIALASLIKDKKINQLILDV